MSLKHPIQCYQLQCARSSQQNTFDTTCWEVNQGLTCRSMSLYIAMCSISNDKVSPPSDPPTQVSPSYPVPLNTQEVNPLSGKKWLKTEFRNSILGHTNQPWTRHDITYQSSSAKEFCSTSKCLFKLLIRNRWIFTSFKNALEGIIVDYTLQTKK